MDTKKIPWDLLVSHLKKETGAKEEAALQEWLSIGVNNDFYNDIVALWNEIRSESAEYNPDTEYYWKQLEMRINNSEHKIRKTHKTLSVSLRKTVAGVAAAVVFFAVAVTAAWHLGKTGFTPQVLFTTDSRICKATAVNGKTQIVLPDGSFVWLNLGSSLSYETSFADNRTVNLDGEALFEVVKDCEHPFTVQTNDVKINVLGTRFNVQAYDTNSDIRVALLEGKVMLSADKHYFEMNPGEIASFDRETHKLSISEDDVVFESFWASNGCCFEAKSLGYICKYLERWYNVSIQLDKEIAESQIYTFSITDEPLEVILQVMSRINPVRYSFGEDRTVTIKSMLNP